MTARRTVPLLVTLALAVQASGAEAAYTPTHKQVRSAKQQGRALAKGKLVRCTRPRRTMTCTFKRGAKRVTVIARFSGRTSYTLAVKR